MKQRIVFWLCLGAFAMDSGTGVSLLFAPLFTLNLMGVDTAGVPEVYIRYIGAFVFAVGTLYGWALSSLRKGRLIEWRTLWLATAWARVCVGVSVATLILSGSLEAAWWSVPGADLGLALCQVLTAGKRGGSE